MATGGAVNSEEQNSQADARMREPLRDMKDEQPDPKDLLIQDLDMQVHRYRVLAENVGMSLKQDPSLRNVARCAETLLNAAREEN
jgi:hypothetical protein